VFSCLNIKFMIIYVHVGLSSEQILNKNNETKEFTSKDRFILY